MTTVPGIANAAVGLATDFQSRYLYKLLTLPVSIGSIIAGRLLADGAAPVRPGRRRAAAGDRARRPDRRPASPARC